MKLFWLEYFFHELKFEFETGYGNRVTSCIPKPIDTYDYEYGIRKVKFIGWTMWKEKAATATAKASNGQEQINAADKCH